QHRRRVEAEQEQRRRVTEARQRQQRQRQVDFPQALFELFLNLVPVPSTADAADYKSKDEPAAQHESPAPTAAAAEPAPSASPAPADVATTVAPTSTSAAEESATSSPALEEAAIVLQRRFRRHVARQAALSTLASLTADFEARQSSFTAPSELAFQSTSSAPSNPPLAYGKANAAFLGHEEFLVSLLSKIDAVSTGGDKIVKQARKDLVRRVEAELAQLDALKEHEWERQSQRSAEASDDEREAAGNAEGPAPSADAAAVDSAAPAT
ncbi:BAG family molecular chaperone regulator, partial [Rhodotorula paludigena]|uniref:BAG family molecular chaperone regulator n=1 Tax=Rhodotorula paludigena TaxID=86838 RepID=UPI00316E7453